MISDLYKTEMNIFGSACVCCIHMSAKFVNYLTIFNICIYNIHNTSEMTVMCTPVLIAAVALKKVHLNGFFRLLINYMIVRNSMMNVYIFRII